VLVAGWTHSEEPRLRLGLETWGRVMDADPELSAAQRPLMAFSPAFLSGLGAEGLAGMRAAAAASGTRRQIDLTLRVDIRDEVSRISAPTLVIGCSLDYLVPVENVRALQRAIPGSRYAELESGHVVFAERPEQLGAPPPGQPIDSSRGHPKPAPSARAAANAIHQVERLRRLQATEPAHPAVLLVYRPAMRYGSCAARGITSPGRRSSPR
jgi:hypothetical protein